jgi:hypothetical protein
LGYGKRDTSLRPGRRQAAGVIEPELLPSRTVFALRINSSYAHFLERLAGQRTVVTATHRVNHLGDLGGWVKKQRATARPMPTQWRCSRRDNCNSMEGAGYA